MKPYVKALPLRACAQLSAATLISSLLAVPVLADDALDAITVTANRMPTENALAPTTVITREQIDRLQINDLATLLSRTPGVDTWANGGLGKSSSVSIRGTSSDHVLVLVDGVKWQSATSGSTAFEDFPVEQIERIEIVRGPRSGLYGSEAIGGVIQIFTRQGQAGKPTPYFSAGVGSKNTQKATVGVSGGDEKTRYNLSYNHLSSNGIDATSAPTYPDHDGYRNNNLSFRVNHQATEDWNIGASFLRANGYNEYDGTGEPVTADKVQQVMAINSGYRINDIWTMNFQLAETRDRQENYRDGARYSHFNTRLRTASWSNGLALNDNHHLNIGIDYQHDAIESDGQYDETSRDNTGIFASWQANVERHEWLLSARHDDNEAFGEYTTGTAEYGYWITDELRISGGAGTGFKSPTFNDLYYPGAGNPDVDPEKSRSYNVAIQGSPVWGNWAVNAYKTDIRDLIAWAPEAPGSWIWRPYNVNDAKIKGIEFEVDTTIADWLVAVDVSFLKPEDKATGNYLTRRAQRLANVHLDKQWGKWSTGASWKLRGRSFDDIANNTRLGGYGLLDLRLAYQVNNDWTVRLTGHNIFDKDYTTADGYNTLDRNVMLTIHYQP